MARTFTWTKNGVTTELRIKSDDVYLILIALAVLMGASVIATLVGVIVNNVALGLMGAAVAGAIYLLVNFCVKREDV